jgi:hypothetical protein
MLSFVNTLREEASKAWLRTLLGGSDPTSGQLQAYSAFIEKGFSNISKEGIDAWVNKGKNSKDENHRRDARKKFGGCPR